MKVRYGVVANIAVSHTAAGGSIPPIGAQFFFHFLPLTSLNRSINPGCCFGIMHQSFMLTILLVHDCHLLIVYNISLIMSHFLVAVSHS